MALAAALAFLLRVSIPAALIGTFVGNPLSWPAIWGASYVAGAWLLGHDPAAAADTIVAGAAAVGETLTSPDPISLNTAMVKLAPIWQPLFAGGLVIGLLAAAGSYYSMLRAVRYFQMRHKA